MVLELIVNDITPIYSTSKADLKFCHHCASNLNWFILKKEKKDKLDDEAKKFPIHHLILHNLWLCSYFETQPLYNTTAHAYSSVHINLIQARIFYAASSMSSYIMAIFIPGTPGRGPLGLRSKILQMKCQYIPSKSSVIFFITVTLSFVLCRAKHTP